jgi:hypothetical protein
LSSLILSSLKCVDTSDNVTKKGKLMKVEDLEVCHNHFEQQAQGQCVLCSDFYCQECLSSASDEQVLTFCAKHQQLYDDHEWRSVSTVISTAETPEAGLKLYAAKAKLWSELNKPCFIETSYELSEQSDLIESHVSLMIREDDFNQVKQLIKELNLV